MVIKNNLLFVPKHPQFIFKPTEVNKSKTYETTIEKKNQLEVLSPEEFINMEIPFYGTVGSVGDISPPPEDVEENEDIGDGVSTEPLVATRRIRRRCICRLHDINAMINNYFLCVSIILALFVIVAIIILAIAEK